MLIVPARSAHAAPPHVLLARSSCRHGDAGPGRVRRPRASSSARLPSSCLRPMLTLSGRSGPMLESVTLVDPMALRSEWALRVPKPLTRWLRAAGMSRLVQWEAVHEVEAPRVLRWRSLSGIENSGIATLSRQTGRLAVRQHCACRIRCLIWQRPSSRTHSRRSSCAGPCCPRWSAQIRPRKGRVTRARRLRLLS